METVNTELAVLGGGPGGYVAAIRASKLGVKTTVIEKENLGGVCLNWGCIPTKALYHVTQTIEELKKAHIFGINVSGYDLNFRKAMERKDSVIIAQRQGIAFHLRKNNINIVSGHGKITSNNSIQVNKENGEIIEILAKNIIIATGSSAASVPPFNLDIDGIIDNKGILSLDKIPDSLVIIGGGVVGCEFANIFNSFGSNVTIIELLPRILSTEDAGVSEVINRVFTKKGIKILTGATVEELKNEQGRFICKVRDNGDIEAEKILVSVGRRPNTSGLGLEEAGVALDEKRFIKVDSHLRTNIPNIYAIGDVIGGLQLAHVASAEGIIAAENIAGKDKTMDYRVIPWAVFTSPEIGTVGINEEQAIKKGIKVCKGLFPFANSGKAFITGETEGFVKVISDSETGEILGAQIIGPRASDLVHEVAVAMKAEMTVDGLAETVHSHPTLSEAVMEAAEDCLGIATHISR